jgi:hypothetical protein
MEMVEVFKTNVKDAGLANLLINHIHHTFPDYKANFDLEDCDKILRVACASGTVQPGFLINILNDFGFQAEVLPDDLQPVGFNGICAGQQL